MVFGFLFLFCFFPFSPLTPSLLWAGDRLTRTKGKQVLTGKLKEITSFYLEDPEKGSLLFRKCRGKLLFFPFFMGFFSSSIPGSEPASAWHCTATGEMKCLLPQERTEFQVKGTGKGGPLVQRV